MTTETKIDAPHARKLLREGIFSQLTKDAESLTQDERAQLREYLAKRLEKDRARLDEAERSRPSYAPGPTTTERELRAVARNSEEVVWAFDEWAAAR